MSKCPKCGTEVPSRTITISKAETTDEEKFYIDKYGYEPYPGEYIEYECMHCGAQLEKPKEL